MKSQYGIAQHVKARDWIVTVIAGSLVSVGSVACASAGSYNPDNLSADQGGHIAQICQVVMGLKPSEPPISALHPGTPHLDPDVSHYQGCIASLSDSVQSVNDAHAARQADTDCRARGLQDGSSELAVCVLQSANANASHPPVMPASSAPVRLESEIATSVKSFNYASAHETVRREQLACASLGLEPPGGDFARCVRNLHTTFFAIDNPLD
jgi:hypothetical protein